MMDGEKGGVKRPLTYLDEDDFTGIERFRKRRGLEKSQAITNLIRVALELSLHDPELCKELEERVGKN